MMNKENPYPRRNQSPDDKMLSPCVRNCCLNEKDICLGCYRHLDEITGWLGFTRLEKIAVLTLCDERRKTK